MSMPFSPCPTDGSACSDASVEILSQVFGPAFHKLATGQAVDEVSAAANVLASLMSVFNSGIMIVGGFIVSAVIFGSVLNTANDGEVMGKAWSTPNTIMRIVAGGGMLLPTASGYSIIQMIILMISLWAIGLANTVYRQGVEVGILGGNLVSTSAQMGITDKTINDSYALADLRTIAEGLTRSLYCAHVANATYVMASGERPAVQMATKPSTTIEEAGRTAKHYWFADQNASTNLAGGSAVCGTLVLYENKAPLTPDASIATLQGIRTAIHQAKYQAIVSMLPTIRDWVSTWPSSMDLNGHDSIQSNRLNEIVRDAESQFQTTLSNSVHADAALEKIMSSYVDSVTQDGWLYAVGYYQRLGEIRGHITRMIMEPVAEMSAPNLQGLPSSQQTRTMIISVNAVPGIVMSRALEKRTTVTPSDVTAVIQNGLESEGGINAIGPKAEGAMSAWVNSSMQGILSTLLGTTGDVDAIARIKATGDIMAIMQATGIAIDKSVYTYLSAARLVTATGGSFRILGSGVNLEPAARTLLDWATYVFLKPLNELVTWLNVLSFYFGVFLPILPYLIFFIAGVGFVLQVLQAIVAAPLWAIMHMTPEKTFIGSQTQGYLLLLGLFVRPALIVLGLFAAFLLINPILNAVTEAFFSMRSAVNTDSIWLVQFLQLRNWLIAYGLFLAPIIYMVFGLSQRLPDAVLGWLNINTNSSDLGQTGATSEMRSMTEKYGPSPSLGTSQHRQLPLPNPRGNPAGNPSKRPSNGGPGSSRGGSPGSLPLLNDQGVTPSTGSTKN